MDAAPAAPEDTPEVYGFNSDVSHRNQTYHVQTESMADPVNPTINTLVYRGGTLVTKVSSSYADLGDPRTHARELAERVKKQHQAMLLRIQKGDVG